MGKTISEKILARAAGVSETWAGDILWVNVDRAMMDDILGPQVEIAQGLRKLEANPWDKEKVVIISDHYTPPSNVRQAEIVKFTRDWAEEYGVENYYEFEGPCHQVMAEQGHVFPGTVVLGTDSHTCMGGSLGAFATGVGSTEMLGILVTGQTWLKVPETIKVVWEGDIPPGTMGKDISLKTIGTIGHAGATYKAIEYTGSTIGKLSMDERMAVTNMAVEMGAKVGLMEPDEKTLAFLKDRPFYKEYQGAKGQEKWETAKSDEDAVYCSKYLFDASSLEPMVACPHQVDNVKPVSEVAGIIIHQCYLGSCTGGRYEDLVMAAKILQGRKVAKGVRLLVSPASREIWAKAEAAGILKVLNDAGAFLLGPTCGVCVGLHSGILANGEVCISSSNRNFIGRMGSKGAEIYLGSPLTVAASAIAGKIADPREWMKEVEKNG